MEVTPFKVFVCRLMLAQYPLQQQIIFRIGALVRRCVLGLAWAYLRELYCPTPGTRGRSPSAQWNGGYPLFLLPVLSQATSMHSRWLAPLSGTGIAPQDSFQHILLQPEFFLDAQGLGALLSNRIEEYALY